MCRLGFLPLLCLVHLAAGCLRAPSTGSGADGGYPPTSLDAGPEEAIAFALDAVEAADVGGRRWPLDDLPRQPVLTLRFTATLPEDAAEGVLWLAGEDDADLRDDLEAAPLRAATRDRAVPTEATALGHVLRLRPTIPLDAGASYVLVVVPWMRDGLGERIMNGTVEPLRVSTRPDAGARFLESWPPDGAAAVPPSRTRILLRFDGPVRAEGGVALTTSSESHPVTTRGVPCEDEGWSSGSCVEVRAAEVSPGRTHRLTFADGLVDATGAPVPGGPLELRYATRDDGTPPRLLALPCALDEAPVEGGCLLADDRHVALRFDAAEPVRASLEGTAAAAEVLAPRGRGVLEIAGLGPDRPLDLRLRLVDLAGLETALPLPTRTLPPLATVSIVEVRSDPLGPEPRQEYVELVNWGDEDVALEGFAVTDDPMREGDVLRRPFRLPPGARVLLVADAFDPADEADDPVPPGAALLRVGSSLGSGGLTNRGEPLFLRDAEGRRVSAAPAVAAPGACLHRREGMDPRRGDDAAFTVGPCSPGR
jgi:hypothetical protein